MTGAVEHGIDTDQANAFSAILRDRGIGHEVLDPASAAERWPGMRFDGPVLHQFGGGILHADRTVAGLQRLAAEYGAEFRAGTRVDRLSLSAAGDEVTVDTAGEQIRARQVVVTVGSWAAKLLDGIVDLPTITVTQEQPRIFEPLDAAHHGRASSTGVTRAARSATFESYGLLESGVGIKVGLHASGPVIDPDRRDFTAEPARDATLHDYVRRWFPGLDPERSTEISCIYDNTDNGDFVIDRFGPVTFATGFNGEGFKFVPLIGQLLRDVVLDAADPPQMFTLARHRSSSG